jgi:polysaccharide export outer membrane protein
MTEERVATMTLEKMVRLGVVLSIAVACGPMLGCAGTSGGALAPRMVEYRIGKEDLIEVTVWKDAALSKTVPVRPDGHITLPLIGELVAAQKTPNQLSQEIRERLMPLVKDPTVQVIVRETNSARFYIVGEVTRPGTYPIHGSLTALEAIAMAGGLTEFARRGHITVIRRTEQGESRRSVAFDDLVKGKARADALAPGDTVYVP